MLPAMTVTTVTKDDIFRIPQCILVSAAFRVNRGVSFHRQGYQIQENPDGSEDSSWHVEKHYKNREESKEADRTYAKARHKLRAVCIDTAIGFVCSMSRKDALAEAIADARNLIDGFNDRSQCCSISMWVVCTRIESNNTEAIATMFDTLSDVIASMRENLNSFSVTKAQLLLSSSRELVNVLANENHQKTLMEARQETTKLIKQIKDLLKDFDNNVENALLSTQGKQILTRIEATWSF